MSPESRATGAAAVDREFSPSAAADAFREPASEGDRWAHAMTVAASAMIPMQMGEKRFLLPLG